MLALINELHKQSGSILNADALHNGIEPSIGT